MENINKVNFSHGFFYIVSIFLMPCFAYSFESDQWVLRQFPLQDSTVVINQKTQQFLEAALLRWSPYDAQLARSDQKAAEKKLFSRVFRTISGPLPTGHLETWLALTNEVDSQDLRTQSVYYNAPVAAVHLNGQFSSCANIRVAGIRIGTDKIRHFFALGAKYYRRVVFDGLSERAALEFGEDTERTYFGFWVSGVYSNADLVANYEGYLFFKSLFESIMNVNGQLLLPLVGWQDGWPYLQRPFRWQDHVSALWDEALFPSYFQPELQLYMDGILSRRFCFNYRLDPRSFEMHTTQGEIESLIARRYPDIRFIYNWQNRLDSLCRIDQRGTGI